MAVVSTSSSSSPQGRELNNWIQARCNGNDNNNKDAALWVYEGALFDPLEGRRIANVEGLEMVHCVASVGSSSDANNKKEFVNRCGGLEVSSLISNENATFDQVSTILSRKLFLYQAPDNPNKLLTSIRLRPNAPKRVVPTKQAVAVYDTATTFIARGQELIAHTEWPDHQSIWGIATRNNNTSTTSFDFTVYARLKSARKTPDQLFDLTKPPSDATSYNKPSNTPPRRIKFIEFGSSSARGKDKFGARETYSYSNIPVVAVSSETDTAANEKRPGLLQRFGLQRRPSQSSSPTIEAPPLQVRYSRYGEGPPFFGPSRICSLELQGRRVSSLEELPPLTASIIKERMSPQFLALCNTTTTTNTFRSSSEALKIRHREGERAEDFWLPDYLKEQGKSLWKKFRSKE